MMQLLHPVDRMPCPKRLALGEADPALFDKEPKASPKRRLAHPDKGSNPRLRRARFKQGALMYRQHGEDGNGGVRLRPQTAAVYLCTPRYQGKQIACAHGMPLYCRVFFVQIVQLAIWICLSQRYLNVF